MKLLVINSGSSSVKYQLYDMPAGDVIAKGLVERIGLDSGKLTHQGNGDKHVIEQPIPTHVVALELVIKALTDPGHGSVASLNEIGAVGHRVVHGGEDFTASALIDEHVIKAAEVNSEMAPLHNPANLLGIKACMEAMPGVPNVAVFDTAFHQTMPKHAYMYAIPYPYYEQYRIRRYGFHGSSHRYVSTRAAEILGQPLDSLKMVTCHLGSGSSLCAVKHGQSVDTSLGFGTISGVPMGTRTGDIDPCVVTYLKRKLNLSDDGLDDLMFKQSGLKGVSGYSDIRDVEEHAEQGEETAQMALDLLAYSTRKYIGSYAAAMGGLDVIVFTAGIGENDPLMRGMILRELEFLGIELDKNANETLKRGAEGMISTPASRVKVLVVPTNEELMIAKDTYEIVAK